MNPNLAAASYGHALGNRGRLARLLGWPKLAGILTSRSLEAYAGVQRSRIDHEEVPVLKGRRWYRTVELEELEARLRAVTGMDLVCGSRLGQLAAHETMKQQVPGYVVPQQILEIDPMPLGPRGKFDRNALRRLAQAATETAA
jgi:acyl-CoA synthetase (AMP-forming)/AMP-acid ligase II